MGLEGHPHRFAIQRVGAVRHKPHHLLMSAVNAVKVSHANHRGTKIGRHFFEAAEYLHGGWCPYRSTSSFRPPCARRTLSGSAALVSSCGRSCEMCVK